MIKRLYIQNFKEFEHLEIPDIGGITLIGGQNNVGKTALLEAIYLFYDTGNPGLLFRHLGWRGIEISTVDAETLFSPIFFDFNIENQININVQDECYNGVMSIAFDPSYAQKSISVEISNKNTELTKTNAIIATSYAFSINYKIDGIDEDVVRLIIKQSSNNLEIQFEPAQTSFFSSSMKHIAIFLPTRLRINPREEAIRFGQLDIKRLNDHVIDVLKILEPRLQGVTAVTLPQGSLMYADVSSMARKVPIDFLGDGMSRLLSITLAIATAKDGVVLIDEIDSGLHYSVLLKIWEAICKAAREFHCQVVATTHSYECLQAAYDGALQAGVENEFHYIRLDRHSDKIVAKTYLHEVLGAALQNGWEVR